MARSDHTKPVPPPAPRFGRADVAWCAAIFLLALGLRIVYVLQLQTYPFFSLPQMDAAFHDEWARAVAAGDSFVRGAYFRAPLYPWFLGGVYALSDGSILAARLVQAVVGALGCVLAFLLGRSAFSRAAGVIAGLAAATYWIFLYFDGELLIPVLLIPLDLLLLWLLIVAARRRRFGWWLAAGVVLGLSAIARPNILLLAPVLVGWILVLHRSALRGGVIASLGLFLGTIAPILPITVRNVVVGGDFALIATQAGVNLYIGNNPGADGMSAVIPGDPAEWWPCFNAQIERAERAAGRKLKGSEVSKWYTQQTWDFMTSQPGKAAELLARKLLYFWSRWEVSNNQDIYFVTSKYTPLTRWLPLSFAIVAPLGVLGMVLVLRRAELFPLWAFVLVYMASVVAFFVTARYRVPVVAVLLVLAAHAVCWMVHKARRREWKKFAAGWIPVLLMAPVVAQVPPGVDRRQIQGHRSVGLYLLDLGRFDEARAMLEQSAAAATGTVFEREERLLAALGRARRETGDPQGAIEAYRRAAEGARQPAPYWLEIGRIHAGAGDLDAARSALRRAIDGDPRLSEAYLEAGIVEALRTDGAAATARFKTALEIDPAAGAAVLERVGAMRAAGRAADALRVAEAARAAAPSDPRLAVTEIELLLDDDATVRDVPRAVDRAAAALERTGRHNPRVLLAAARAYAAAGDAATAESLLVEARAQAQARGNAALVQEIETARQRARQPSP